MVLKILNSLADKFGYQVIKKEPAIGIDILQDKTFLELYEKCKPYTMTSAERMYALYTSMLYVLENRIPGDFVECGVWRGGSSMLMALTLQKHNITDRKIHLYDTYEGMSEPSAEDVSFSGDAADKLLSEHDRLGKDSVWCYSSIDEVKANLLSTGYPAANLFFLKGKVEDTLLTAIPSDIALLRLDTDWYESTKMELNVLYPLLAVKGVLLIDDFGHWEGAKKAVIEYFAQHRLNPYIHRIDYTGRLIIK